MLPKRIPNVTFHTRIHDTTLRGANPYRWQDVTTQDLFANKKVVLFSLPGAFTPTCSTFQLPDFERLAPAFKEKGIDEIYCMSVNDSFVMNKWATYQMLKHIKVIPDGSGAFTYGMNMLVQKDNLGFGARSWRYAAVINNCEVMMEFIEAGQMDNCPDDPYEVTTPQNILAQLGTP